MLSSAEIQGHLYTALTAIVGASAAVYDAVPQDASFPYVAIGNDTEAAYNALVERGKEATVTLHIFSRYQGMAELKALASAITDALELSTFTTSHFRVGVLFDFWTSFMDPDGITRHGVIRFRMFARKQ